MENHVDYCADKKNTCKVCGKKFKHFKNLQIHNFRHVKYEDLKFVYQY